MKLAKLYSIRMRAAQGGPHELGGKHISGGENLSGQENVHYSVSQLINKAQQHLRGQADFVQITIDEVAIKNLVNIPPQTVTTIRRSSVTEALIAAKAELMKVGVSEIAVMRAIAHIQKEPTHRGAIIMNAQSGLRIDDRGLKGVRVSRVDWIDSPPAEASLELDQRIRESRAIAAKVAHSPYTVAELCCSDDPGYLTGYVSSQRLGYVRISPLKHETDEHGGRVFFVEEPIDLEEYITYLELMPILIGKVQV